MKGSELTSTSNSYHRIHVKSDVASLYQIGQIAKFAQVPSMCPSDALSRRAECCGWGSLTDNLILLGLSHKTTVSRRIVSVSLLELPTWLSRLKIWLRLPQRVLRHPRLLVRSHVAEPLTTIIASQRPGICAVRLTMLI